MLVVFKLMKLSIIAITGHRPNKLWMVDNCDLLIAVHDGSPGGTANCVNYANQKNKKIININPKHFNNEANT